MQGASGTLCRIPQGSEKLNIVIMTQIQTLGTFGMGNHHPTDLSIKRRIVGPGTPAETQICICKCLPVESRGALRPGEATNDLHWLQKVSWRQHEGDSSRIKELS